MLPLALTCSCAAAWTLATELEAMHWYTPASEVTRPRMRRLVPRTICAGRRGYKRALLRILLSRAIETKRRFPKIRYFAKQMLTPW